MSVITDNFEDWWATDGKFYDPDTQDVHWYDKRKGLAEYAYQRGKLVTTRWAGHYAGAESQLGGDELLKACNRSLHKLIEQAWKALEPTGEYEGDMNLVEFAIHIRELAERNSAVAPGTNLLQQALDQIMWMSGSADFSPGGQAHEGWVKTRGIVTEISNFLRADFLSDRAAAPVEVPKKS